MCDAFDTIYSGSTSAFNTVDSVQLMLGVLAVFRPSVLVILPLLDLVQVSILRGAVVLAALQGFLLRENAGAGIVKLGAFYSIAALTSGSVLWTL